MTFLSAILRLEVGAERRWGRGTMVEIERGDGRVLVRVLDPNGGEVIRAFGESRTEACNTLLRALHLTQAFEED